MMEKSRDRFMARFKEATRLAREQKNRRAAGQPAFSGDWPGEDERGAGVAAGYSRIEIEAVARAVAAFVAALSPEQRDFFFECMLGETRIADYRGWKGQFELYEEKRSLLGGLVKCFRKNGINPETVGRESILAAFSKISADQSAKDPIPAVLKGEG
jgi:hypothetical protein